MVATRANTMRRIGCWSVAALLLATASTASANTGLIASSRVTIDESGDSPVASIVIRFNCKVHYVRHNLLGSGDQVRIFLEPTSICNGVSPTAANTRSRLRPFNSDSAHLLELEYDGDVASGPVLTLTFSKPVSFDIDTLPIAFDLVVRVRDSDAPASLEGNNVDPGVEHRQVAQASTSSPPAVINLATFRRIPTLADAANLNLAPGQKLYYQENVVDGKTMYRLRLGTFDDAEQAKVALADVLKVFPDAWIDTADDDRQDAELESPSGLVSLDVNDNAGASKVDRLMQDARKAIAAGETSRAIQIYTKVLQLPEHPRQAEAQEFLGLAREKNGQIAHAKAEYQRYLSLYADAEGADRVQQRLSVLLTSNRAGDPSAGRGKGSTHSPSNWRYQTYFSQYYRRDVNQQNDQDEIVSQSALYSDVNFDARRRGDRFDFSSRLSAGYRNSFLDGTSGDDNTTRISYAYADLADAVTGLRGRFGRQSRNSGGVLGRFDGLNLGYQINERLLLNTVVGKPAYSSSDDVDSSRTFYGASINYGPILSNLDLGLFYIEQDVEGIQDRQAVGAEFRYFGESQSLWGRADYDLSYGDLASAFLQGSWRFDSRLTLHALVNQRGSPFLSTSNAMIGQPVLSFAELATIFSEDELRQLAEDRTSISTTYTIGVSYPLTPRFQINVDASKSGLDGTPGSGGVLATPDSNYSYYSTSLIASSLLKEGDVSIISARYSDTDTSNVVSLHVDTRIPFGRTWRINPRLRVDRRQRISNPGYEWLYTPGIRIQYRKSQKFRLELEAGKQFSQQDTNIPNLDLDRESYFINLGYQAFF